TRLLAVRERVLAEIEPLRKSKQIGSSLQAKVALAAPPAELALLDRHRADLPMLFIVSEVELRQADGADISITISRAGGGKCERCWGSGGSIPTDPAWAGLCDRCKDALSRPDEDMVLNA